MSSASAPAFALSEFSKPVDAAFEAKFARAAHIKYVLQLDAHKDTIEYQATEHLRLSAIYWAAMAMDLMGALSHMDRDGVLAFVKSCEDPQSGGFGGNAGHDAHLLYTLSAVQLYALFDAMDRVDVPRVAAYVASLQRPDGSFVGDKWGEVDTRFTYCALNLLGLIGRLDASTVAPADATSAATSCGVIDVPAAVRFLVNCRNFDGGFGAVPGAESHSGQIFCCLGALALADAVSASVDRDVLGWWLCERQLPCGGLNGRPEKKEDVCYSWWVITGLSVLDRLHWIDGQALCAFILGAQDPADGGISDRPDCMTDVYHTYFGIAGLSLLGSPGLERIDPVWALPVKTVRRMGLKSVPYAYAD